MGYHFYNYRKLSLSAKWHQTRQVTGAAAPGQETSGFSGSGGGRSHR